MKVEFGGGKITIDDELTVWCPVTTLKYPDEIEGCFCDAFDSCSSIVPLLPGIGDTLVTYLGTTRRDYYDFCYKHLAYNKFNANNPGHVWLCMQCFAGEEGAMVRDFFLASVMELVRKQLKTATDGKIREMTCAVISYICKALGSCARGPIIPRICGKGQPPDICKTLSDCICSIHPSATSCKGQLDSAIRRWQVPKWALDRGAEVSHWGWEYQYERSTFVIKKLIQECP